MNTAFTCKLTSIRYQPNGENCKITSYSFFDKVPTSYIAIGNSDKCDIQVDELLPTHVRFNFQNEKMVLVATGEIEIIAGELNEKMAPGKLLQIPFGKSKLVDTDKLLTWNIKIENIFELYGEILAEQQFLDSTNQKFFQDNYGPIIKVAEDDSIIDYQTTEHKTIKVLSPMSTGKKTDFLERLQSFACISCKQLAKFNNVSEKPIPHGVIDAFDGVSLTNYLAQKGKITSSETMSILYGVLKVLKKTSKENVVCHLHAKDIFFNNSQVCVVPSLCSPVKETLAGDQGQYFAPECHKGEDITPQADIFALGSIVYLALTGKPLFENTSHYLKVISSQDFIDQYYLQRSCSWITPQLAELLEGMLSFNKNERPNISELFKWLEDISDISLWEQAANLKDADGNPARYCLHVVESVKELKGKVLPLRDDDIKTIGRIGDVQIKGDIKISRNHAQITVKNSRCIVKDMQSRNGVYIDGNKISEQAIESGEAFTIGHTTMYFWNCEQLKNERDTLLKGAEPTFLFENSQPEAEADIDPMRETMADFDEDEPVETVAGGPPPVVAAKKISSQKLRDVYSDLEEITQERRLASGLGKRRRGRPLASNKPERDAKLRELYKKMSIAAGVFLVLFMAFFYYAFVTRVETKPRQSAQTQESQQDAITPTTTPQASYKKKNYHNNADARFLKKVRQRVFTPKAPSQRLLNSILKELHIEGKKYFHGAYKGDLHNLIARLYHYKIYLDKEEQFFESYWKDTWRQEIIDNVAKARKAYKEEKAQTNFQLVIMAWMPERKLYKDKLSVVYKSPKDGLKDLEKWSGWMQEN